jgi:preprotein translocase subunit SecG
MKLITTIGLVIFLFIALGFVLYLMKLNRQAKKEQSEVDPNKLRKWGDD